MASPPRPRDRGVAYPLHDERTGHCFLVCNQPSNIEACVAFSLMRCILSIISILLAITDIPRTGLAVDPFADYAKVAPSTVMYYGPYAYPVVHLNTTECSSNGSGCDLGSTTGYSGNSPVTFINVWAYKFDSLSIPIRALVEHLNVSTYPSCMLYKAPCPTTTITLDTVFTMMNDLVTTIQHRYFSDESRHNRIPVVFKTDSFWADRLHHVLLGEASYRVDRRTHSVHYFTAHGQTGLNVCKIRTATHRHRPLFCGLVAEWLCDHPTLGPPTQISIQQHIRLRSAALQQQYPNTRLDLTMIVTKRVVQSQRVAFLPIVFYSSDNLEITTIIRGRRCQADGTACTIAFLDDYRYERAVLESSSGEMNMITGTLRAVSQVYVWLRVFLLGFVCYKSRLAETLHRSKSIPAKIRVVALTLLKIPSHALVYSSWFPILGYSCAHFIDCGPVHLISDGFWSTTNGFFTFEFFRYVVVATVQMRNIWLIALFWKCTVTVYAWLFHYRYQPWRPQDGVLAFRGVFIGLTSLLTIFSFVRALRFRNSHVLRVDEMPRDAGTMSFHFPTLESTMSDFGLRLDIKTTAIASVIVGAVGLSVQTFFRVYAHWTTNFFACHNYYVPTSTGTLYPVSALNVFWYIRLRPLRTSLTSAIPKPQSQHSPFRLLYAVMPVQVETRSRQCDVCSFASTPLNWRPTQGCLRHESLFSVGARSVETQSMVRLMNIGMLSDPIVFVRLRLFGRPLYLYRVRNRSSPCSEVRSSAAVAPGLASLESDYSFMLAPALLSDKMGQSRPHTNGFELVAEISSRVVPWTLLVDCG